MRGFDVLIQNAVEREFHVPGRELLGRQLLARGSVIGCHFTPLRRWIVYSSLSWSNSHDSASAGSNLSGSGNLARPAPRRPRAKLALVVSFEVNGFSVSGSSPIDQHQRVVVGRLTPPRYSSSAAPPGRRVFGHRSPESGSRRSRRGGACPPVALRPYGPQGVFPGAF